jgi:hypothetical protein
MECLSRITNPIIERTLGNDTKVLKSAIKISQICGVVLFSTTIGAFAIGGTLPTIIVLQSLSLTAFIISTLVQNLEIKILSNKKIVNSETMIEKPADPQFSNFKKGQVSSKEEALEKSLKAKNEEIAKLKKEASSLHSKKEKGKNTTAFNELEKTITIKNQEVKNLTDELASSRLDGEKAKKNEAQSQEQLKLLTVSLEVLQTEKKKIESELQNHRKVSDEANKQAEEIQKQFKEQVKYLTSELDKLREVKTIPDSISKATIGRSKNTVEIPSIHPTTSLAIKTNQQQSKIALSSSSSEKNSTQKYNYKVKTYNDLLELNQNASQAELLSDLVALNKLLSSFAAFADMDFSNGHRPLIVLDQSEMKFSPKPGIFSNALISLKLSSRKNSIEQNLSELSKILTVFGSKIDYLNDKQFTDEHLVNQVLATISCSITALSLVKIRYSTIPGVLSVFQKTKGVFEDIAEKTRMLMPLPDIDRHDADSLTEETETEESFEESREKGPLPPPPVARNAIPVTPMAFIPPPPPPLLASIIGIAPPPPPPPPGMGLASTQPNLSSVITPAAKMTSAAEERKRKQIADCEQELATAQREQAELSDQTRAAKNKYNELELERKKYSEKLVSALRGYQILEGRVKDKEDEHNKFALAKKEFQDCLKVLKEAKGKKDTLVVFQNEEHSSEEKLNKLEKELKDNLPAIDKAVEETKNSIDKLAKELETKVVSQEFGDLRQMNEEYKKWDNTLRAVKNSLIKFDQALGEKKTAVKKLETTLKKLTSPVETKKSTISSTNSAASKEVNNAKLMEEIQKKGKNKSAVTNLMTNLGLPKVDHAGIKINE